MKGQISAVLGRLNLGKLAVLAIVVCGLLAVPHPARVQEQSEIAEVGQAAVPLTGVVSSTQNPLQIAILHWYNANQTTSFAVGTFPGGVGFDGANIWVVSEGSNTVTKLRASDGTKLGTFAVGAAPEELAFDGANIWVATGCLTGTISKL